MPIRKNNAGDGDVERRTPISKEGKLNRLAQLGAYYLKLKKDAKSLTEVIAKENTKIKSAVKDSEGLFEINGKHLELYAPLGDGMNEIFIQIQHKESVGVVDNILALVKDKLGEEAKNFIMVREVLHDNALESMLNQGLITKKDILDWTTTKESESLIVQANKKRV